MFRSINNMPIFRRLFTAFALATAIPGIVVVLLGAFYLNALDIRGQAVQTSFNAQNTAYEQQINLQRMNAELQARHAQIFASLGGSIKDPSSIGGSVRDPSLDASGALIYGDILSRELDFDQTLTKYRNDFQVATSDNMSNIRNILVTDDPHTRLISDQGAALNTVLQEWPAYKRLQDRELTLLQKGAPYSQAYAVLFNANARFLDLTNSWQRVVTVAERMGTIVTTIGPSQTNPIILATVIAFLITIMVVVTVGYIVNLTITRPLRQLAVMTRRIAKGETSARAKIMGRDEIYMVANSMNNMLDNIVRLIQEAQAQRDSLQAQVEKLVSEVSGVGEGDLRIQAEVTADALGVLADSFNYMVEELGGLIVRVKAVAHEVEDSATTILDRMTQLVETGDIQIGQITEAAVEVEHMAGSSRQVAERSQILYEVAREARVDAQGGREAVEQAVGGMRRINDNVKSTANKVQTLGERSREINEIVEAISSIAHQTNRLALDAAIQAAMAGENGKGFGAVAADIRRLAEKAKEQTSSITRIVRDVREDIGAAAAAMQDTERETTAGTKLTQEAGVALESIFAVVEQQAREIENINQMAMQQLQSSSAVVQIMQNVSEATQQSSRSTRDASQNMDRLTRLVEQLRSSVEAFKLRNDQAYSLPNSHVNVSMQEEQEPALTMSGLFRTISATAHPAAAGLPSPLPPRPAEPFTFYPMAPNQQYGNENGARWEPAPPQRQRYSEEYDERNGKNGNGSRNRR